MDPEEIRIQKLIRAGREKIIKYGTYEVDKAKRITQNHPFYVQLQDEPAESPQVEAGQPQSEADLAASIMSSNFKVGLSQDEVDALLRGML